MSTLTKPAHAAWCLEKNHAEGDNCGSADIDIPGVGWVYLGYCPDEGVTLQVIDPKRGLHEFGTDGQYGIDEAEKVALAMLEAVRIARSDAMSASVSTSDDVVAR